MLQPCTGSRSWETTGTTSIPGPGIQVSAEMWQQGTGLLSLARFLTHPCPALLPALPHILALSFIHTWRPRLGSDSGFSFEMSHVLFVATELRCHQERTFKNILKGDLAFQTKAEEGLLRERVGLLFLAQGPTVAKAGSSEPKWLPLFGETGPVTGLLPEDPWLGRRSLSPGESPKGACHRFPDYRCGWLLGRGPGAPWLVQANSCSALSSDLPMSEPQLDTVLSFFIPSQLVTVGREPSHTWLGVSHVPRVRTFLHSLPFECLSSQASSGMPTSWSLPRCIWPGYINRVTKASATNQARKESVVFVNWG